MYLNYYGFKKEPFQITPDPEFLFLSPSHKEAMASIIYGIEEKKGFVAIFGGVGVGKTTILRAYLERVNKDQAKLIYIFNANLTFKSLLTTIYQDLGITVSADDIFLMVNRLHEALVEEYKNKHSVVLIIDEAQNMPIETLENLRMLSNLETSTDKLIQIVLIGQPEFEDNLNRYELRQLRQRIAIRATILPLTREESARYIEHRLSKVMIKNEPVFTKGAIKEIAAYSEGIPRVINIICDNAFITGYGYQKKPVTAKIVREISADFRPKNSKAPEQKHESSFRWKTAAALMVAFVAAGAFWLSPYKPQSWEQLRTLLHPYKELPLPKTEAKLIPMPEAKAVDVPVEPPVVEEPAPKVEPLVETRKPAQPPRIVQKGDTLSKLILAKYGSFDGNLLQRVKQSNPGIKDVNKIYTGDAIVFPSAKPQEEARADR
jgi:general secretion pathway protein A